MELHLRFHGYGAGEWTDSAVRRYVRDAGPLLERLHKLTRSDCTTRNKRRAAALSGAYTELENRIETLREQEAVDALRPELDGFEIGERVGVSQMQICRLLRLSLGAMRVAAVRKAVA